MVTFLPRELLCCKISMMKRIALLLVPFMLLVVSQPSFAFQVTPPITCTNSVVLNTQAKVNTFGNCEIMNAVLTISGADIQDLTPLSNLKHVTILNIYNNPMLTSLNGLHNLTSVTSELIVYNNPLLTNLEALQNLSTTGVYQLKITDNPQLASLAGLEGIKAAGWLEISNNDNLHDLHGLEGIISAGTALLIRYNDGLQNLDGLSSFITAGNINITYNSSLENIQGLINLTNVANNLTLNNLPSLTSLAGLENLSSVVTVSIKDNAMLSQCCGIYPYLSTLTTWGTPNITSVSFLNNINGCNSFQEILDNCVLSTDFVDIELGMIGPTSAVIYTSYPITLTIENKGMLPATGVKVKFAKPNGVVYTGGNEATASQGTFDVFGDEVWNIGTIAAGASATLTVSYFLLQSSLPVAYAQVIATNEVDIDSAPNNGTPPSPNEDDEASSNGPPPAPKPDLSLSGLSAPDLTPGFSSGFDVGLQVANLAVSGSYTIGIYLSSDNTISADDYQFPSLSEQNTAVGNFARNSTLLLPDNFPLGNYYLILKVDAGDAIAESDEGNNVIYKSVNVASPQVVCTGDIILESQAELDAFSGCNIIEGDFIIRSPNGPGGASSDITDLSPLLSVKQVTGFLIIENNDQLLNLNGLDSLTSIGGLSVVFCQNLTDIQALAGIHGELSGMAIISNPSIPSLNGLEGITKVKTSLHIEDNESLQNLDGLSNVDSLAIIGPEYSLGIWYNPALKNMHGLQNLTYVGGSLTIVNCIGLESLAGLENLASVGRDLVLVDNIQLQDLSALDALTHIGQNLPVQRNYLLADCCIFKNLLNSNGLGGTAFISDNASGCNSISEIQTNCQTQGIDLELSISAPSTAPIYSSYPVEITVTNTGGIPATGVKVKFAKPNGVVYTGGNEATSSQGTFDVFGNEVWNVGILEAGANATLTVNYFLLENIAIVAYAEVIAANENDLDSSPDNGDNPFVNEDDEGKFITNGPTNLPSDLILNNFQLSNETVTSSESLHYLVDMKNIGEGHVVDSFYIRSYISTDNILSADDIEAGLVKKGFFPSGLMQFNISFSSPLASNFAIGVYYLILKVDADNEISESNENNNIIMLNFSVISNQSVCTGDIIVESQDEVNSFPGCIIVDGNLKIQSPNGLTGASSDIYDLSPLMGLKEITGNLEISNNDYLLSLHGLEDLIHINALAINYCDSLTDILPLLGISGELNTISITKNLSLLNIDGLNGVTSVVGTVNIADNAALTHINGLTNLTSAATPYGSVFSLVRNPSLTNIQGLEKLSNVGSFFAIDNCSALQALDGLENLSTVGMFVLTNNPILQDVGALTGLTHVENTFTVTHNPMLEDCCVFYNILYANEAGYVTIEDNAGLCNSPLDILDNCLPFGDIDVSLSIISPYLNPAIYTSVEVTLTISNEGPQAATGVFVEFAKPSGTVYTGGNEWIATQGTFNPFGNEQWYINSIPPGGSESITVRYFLLTTDVLKPYAQVLATNEMDGDSSPANGTCCTANEDDEASITLNGFTGGNGSTALKIPKDKRQRLWFEQFYPSPAKYSVNMSVYSPFEQMITLNVYDQQGRVVKVIETDIEKGMNGVELFIGDWRSGTYNVVAIGEKGLPAYGRFQKVWE